MKIQCFEPNIYPRKLWVVTDANEKSINQKFIFFTNNGGICNADFNLISDSLATTCVVAEKKTMDKGIMVFLNNEIKIGTIAHESVHVADIIFQELGMYTQDFSESNEPYAYLVGWIANCISKCVVEHTKILA